MGENDKVKPHQESNDDSGDQASYKKDVTPQKEPNQQPEQPLKEQK
jgi:hypothetical protein